jgi:hydrogenase expression/formation protein HypD
MKYLDEYRDGEMARALSREIGRIVTRPWKIMEICGGQTHAIMRYGIDELLPAEITLVHGPGCPVCVTPLELIDQALAIASRAEVILCSFGDMLRVPGSQDDLFTVRARGGDVRVVYSPLDCLRIARAHPTREIVFFAVGFETTAPVTAMAVAQAAALGIENFSLLVSHVLVPPAMEAILAAPGNSIEGFLAAGHVCAVMGTGEYPPLAARYQVPIVITGFEPLDLLQGILMCVGQLEQGQAVVENQYARSVRAAGNESARRLLAEVFTTTSRKWRGMGEIPRSGLALAADYRRFDATLRFDLSGIETTEPEDCLSGQILQGLIRPPECPAFGVRCTPESPLGAPMVSNEGACAAYYRYGRERASSAAAPSIP